MKLIILLSTRYNSCYNYVIIGALISGNIKIFFSKQCRFDCSYFKYAIKTRRFKILKWTNNNGYSFESWIFNRAIKNKHLDILKFAYKNNYIRKNIYQQAI